MVNSPSQKRSQGNSDPSWPPVLTSFTTSVLPRLHRATQGPRILRLVADIQKHDRWISFDRFHQSAQHLVNLYKKVGAQTHIEPIPTGARIGSGRWIIHEACDVHAVTVDIISPAPRRIADFQKNPLHSLQWSAATPPQGLTGDLFVLRHPKQLGTLPPHALTGKIVLMRHAPRDWATALMEKGAAAVLTDFRVPNHPAAVSWSKFGWGGIPIRCPVRPVGAVLSTVEGDRLRQLARRGPVRLRIRVDATRYQGTHDLVSGLILGHDAKAGEIWVLAHNTEPGALDNASGVAACVEIAHVLESLIAKGQIPRPRRTIRMLHGFECYSFFWALEHAQQRYGKPRAGVVIDSIGCHAKYSSGRLQWHDTVSSSAPFVNDLGAAIIAATLQLDSAGHRLLRRPFTPTSDNLVGDPQFGFPCPWITTCVRNDKMKLYDAYHSSADTTAIMSPAALKACTTAMAGYLLFLADMNDTQALALADWETAQGQQRLTAIRRPTPAQITYEHDRLHQSLTRLAAFASAKAAQAHITRSAPLHPRRLAAHRKTAREKLTGENRIPRRIAPLTPTPENMSKPIADQIKASKLSSYALFWANGQRNLREIRACLCVDSNKEVTAAQVAQFFEAHAALGYVTW